MAISNIEMHKRITRHLENSHILLSPENEWFKQCVDFFISDNPNCDVKDLSEMVVEQLSLSDFQEIGLFSLPANLNNCDKKVLTGKYCLQVNTILDVGQSCYSQYNILVKRDTTNTEIGDDKPAPWEPKTHRMLKMMCSDGQQDIVAMEYEPLQCLKEPFIPGFKIVVVGPVEYRKGVLLLKSSNVHFIGGEVEHLLIKNAPLNVLCRALNKPELENPYMFSNIEVENAVMEVHEPSDIIPPRRIENVSTIGIREQNAVIPPTSTNQSNNSNRAGSGIITYDDFFDGDDDLLYLTQMAEIETRLTQPNNVSLQTFGTDQNNTKVNKTTTSVSKNNNITNKKPAVTVKQTKISDMLGPSTSTAFRGSLAESTRCQNDRIIENNSRNVQQVSAKRIASSPVYTETKRPSIESQIPDDDWGDINMDVDVSNPSIKVLNSASIVKNSKIQVKQNEWICSGIVMDESKHEEAEFSSEVLERLIGISSKEVLQLKNNPLNCAPLKEKIEKGIKGAYRKLHLFKDTTHFSGPNPCSYVGCHQATEKRTSTMNHSNPACVIKSCDQTACYVMDTTSFDELKTFWIVSKINFRLLNSEEQPSLKICFCEAHYNQVFLISQCELCRNRSMHMVTLQKDKVREYQLILDEDCIPVTIQYDIFICKPCKFYILLRNDKTITITCELQKHIDAVITRIKNKNISITKGLERVQLTKNVINMKKKEENNQFLMVIFLSENVHNFFTANSSIPSQLVSSVLRLNAIKTLPPLVSSEIATVMESFTVSIVATALGTGLTTEKQIAALTKEKWDEKFTVENLTMSTFNRKKSILLYEIFSVPRTKNRELPSVKRTTPDHNPLYNKSFVFEQVPNPYLFEPNKCMKVLEPISPVKKPTQLQTNQSYQNKLDSPSTSSRTEFPELSRQRSDPTTLSSTTPDLIQLFENLKIPYSNGTDFIKHLLNLETCRCLGTLIVGNNKTTHRQRTSNTATTSPYIINCSPEHKELLSISHADDDDTDLKNYDCLSDKYVPSVNHNNSVSNFVPAKKTPKSCNIPKQKSDFPKIFINKPPQYHYSCASKNQTLIYLPRIKDILTFTDAAAVEKSATVYNTTALTMFKTVGSTSTDTGVSPAIDANSITPISRTANDDTTSIKIYTAITNAITTKSSISAKRFEQLSLLWRKIRRKSSIRKVKHPLKRLNHSRLILMNSKESITTLFCKPRTQRTIRRIG